LGGQFELKYQSIFHQVGLPPAEQHRAHGVRAAYEEDRARLDAVVTDAERQINAALAELSPKRESAHAAARMAAVTAARKSG
jgi:4'-phosphopantetheinyl transferase EntD